MTLAPGKTLLQYRILDKLGEGGMGVVWEAIDSRLDRSAAIKVLPETVADDPERLARFEREAKLLASLSHPGIAAVYGLDEADGVHFIAMEKVPGATLEDRLSAGPLPLDDAIDVAGQIAAAVSFAHRNGVLHRDLKPANVKITPDGKVKVLDFGLAKAFEAASTVSDATDPGTPTLSPTVTSAHTLGGMILGTAAYMSPEQARARPVDNRTDVFSFGCVLFELLTGRRAFAADTVPDTLARVLQSEPDWAALPAATPAILRRLLERCLEKDADRRLHDVADARFDLEAALAPQAVEAPPGAGASPLTARRSLLLVGLGVALGVVLGGWFAMQGRAPVAPRLPAHLTIVTGADQRIFTDQDVSLAVVPDGSAIVYAGLGADDERRLYYRSLAEPTARSIEGTQGAKSAVVSPDGEWIGFHVGESFSKVPIGGGSPVALTPQAEVQQGAAWSSDGFVYFVASYLEGFDRVPVTGGEVEVLTELDPAVDEFGHWQPLPVPGGRHVLFSRWKSKIADCSVHALNLQTREIKPLLENACTPRLTANGYLLFARGNSIAAVAFDSATATVRGEPRGVLDDVYVAPATGAMALDIASNGTLVYVTSSQAGSRSSLVSVDLQGRVEPIDPRIRDHSAVSLSPDGRSVALQIRNGVENDIWIHDLERDAMRRFTFDGSNTNQCWTRDGKRLTFASLRRGPYDVFWKPVDESESELTLLSATYDLMPQSWSTDGRLLVSHLPSQAENLWVHSFDGRGESDALPLVASPRREREGRFSPDDRWIAYSSSVSGKFEVYVRPTPPASGQWQISIDGGGRPNWSPDGDTLYYVADGALYSVALDTRSGFSAGRPRRVFGAEQLGGKIWDYAPHPDGKRFIVLRSEQTRDAAIQVVLNWTATLEP